MRLLVTRPAVDGQHTAERLRALGHRAVLAPALRVEEIDAELPPGLWTAVILTSANAARVLATHPQRHDLTIRPAFTVGRRTADAAREAGFTDVMAAYGAVEDLIAMIRSRMRLKGMRLLYLAGETRTRDLDTLEADGAKVVTLAVYRTVPAEEFVQVLKTATNDGFDGVLHYSRRSAEVFLDGAERAAIPEAVQKARHFCLSEEVAAPLRAAGAGRIRIALRPEEVSLLALLGTA